MTGAGLAFIISADWARHTRKRSVWIADVGGGTVRRAAHPRAGWTLAELLRLGSELATQGNGPVLLGIDAVLGMPRRYFDRARETASAWAARSFVELLPCLAKEPMFFEPVSTAANWSVNRPFFRVPAGPGSLTAFVERAGGRDVLLRSIDIQAGAKPPFLISGIPGTVGSGTRALWQELAPLLERRAHGFKLWPFDGALGDLLTGPTGVLAETYPRICYALALAAQLPVRPRLLAKTQADVRKAFLDQLTQTRWVQDRVSRSTHWRRRAEARTTSTR